MKPQILDVRWIFAPFNQIKVRMALEQMKEGEVIEVFSEGGNQFNEVCAEILKLKAKIEQIDKITNNSGYPHDYKIRVLKKDI